MADSPYPTFKESFGTLKRQYNERFDPRLIQAIHKYKEWHKKEFGHEPSRSDIFSTAVLQHNDRIRGYYMDIVRKEKKSGRKYLDGIKDRKKRIEPGQDHPVWNDDFSDV